MMMRLCIHVASDRRRVSRGLRHLFGFHPRTRGRSKICYASGGLNQNVQVVEATCCARNFPLSWYGTSWCSISVLLRDGLITPDLTGTQHGVGRTGEATRGSDASNLPTEALLHLLVGLR